MSQLPLFGRRRALADLATIAEQFEAFDREHPEVWRLFQELTLDLVKQGRKRYSADAIVHRIRWHFEIESGRDDFKLNNNYTALLARKWARIHPEHAGFFETRERRAA